jgi:hypothetical protein
MTAPEGTTARTNVFQLLRELSRELEYAKLFVRLGLPQPRGE